MDEAVPGVQVAREDADEHRDEQYRERDDRPVDVLVNTAQADRPAGVRDMVDQHPEQRAEGDVEGEDIAKQVRVEELLRVDERADDEHQARYADDQQPVAEPTGRRCSPERRDAVRQPVRVGERRRPPLPLVMLAVLIRS